MTFQGFGFSGYRSFGDQFVKIAPLKKINLVIGQNNSGKSNILTFFNKHLHSIFETIKETYGAKLNFANLDIHISSSSVKPKFGFFIDIKSPEFEDRLRQRFNNDIDIRNKESLITLLSDSEFFDENGFSWFIYEAPSLSSKYEFSPNIETLKNKLKPVQWEILWRQLTRCTGGDLYSHWIPETIKSLPNMFIPSVIPQVVLIPAIRKIGDPGTSPDDYSGLGIIERLAELQNPSLENQKLKVKFNDINTFLRNVLENKSATIEIPHDRKMILVHMDNKTLPLSSLGTGIHEVVILAAASTILENSILCVEEPELHLHPLLQRKLIQFLSDNTSNQYIFTTHSAHLLETSGAGIFHITYNHGKTNIEVVDTAAEKSNICHDLGYKASDILQANCIIWVEGPSDRIYINFWLKHIDNKLVEGIHYSIMFYGGKLFSHLTANDYDSSLVQDFISLRRLNRNACIVFDSDKEKPRAHINDTKMRLKNEFNAGPGFAWVTKGREIENYLPTDALEQTVKSVHPSANKLVSKDQWANTLKYKTNNKKEEMVASKVKVARHYVNNFPPDLTILDLEEQMDTLKKFIYDSNGLQM